MNRLALRIPRLAALLAATLAAAIPASASAAPNPPVHELGPVDTAVVNGLPHVSPAALKLRLASAVKVSVPTKGADKAAAQRKTSSHAAVYRSLPVSERPLLPTQPAAGELFDFVTLGDSAQAWATMTTDGVPHLIVRGFGEFEAEAMVSWSASYTVPGTASNELVLRFVIPEVVVGGVTEEEGRAWWRSRLRADVLVNGHPAWSTEALRLRADYRVRHPTDPMETVRRPLVVLQQFGEPLAFPTNDEDLPPTSGGPSNDTGIENADYPAERKVVYLSLGRFAAGAQIELSLVMHGIALTVPTSPGGSDHRCRERDVPDTWFCSRASLAVNGGVNDSPRLYLVP
jgi:hypothetical protein